MVPMRPGVRAVDAVHEPAVPVLWAMHVMAMPDVPVPMDVMTRVVAIAAMVHVDRRGPVHDASGNRTGVYADVDMERLGGSRCGKQDDSGAERQSECVTVHA